MKKINGIPVPYDFNYVRCPSCKSPCAIEFKDGPDSGSVQCMTNDVTNHCKYFGDNKGNRRKRRRKAPRRAINKLWGSVKKKIIREVEYLEETDLLEDHLNERDA